MRTATVTNGIPVETIAKIVGCHRITLNKTCRRELDIGSEQVKAAMGIAVVRAGLAGDWRASISWLSRFGGSEWHKPVTSLAEEMRAEDEQVVHFVSIEQLREMAEACCQQQQRQRA
jgi:hypothetical protein